MCVYACILLTIRVSIYVSHPISLNSMFGIQHINQFSLQTNSQCLFLFSFFLLLIGTFIYECLYFLYTTMCVMVYSNMVCLYASVSVFIVFNDLRSLKQLLLHLLFLVFLKDVKHFGDYSHSYMLKTPTCD